MANQPPSSFLQPNHFAHDLEASQTIHPIGVQQPLLVHPPQLSMLHEPPFLAYNFRLDFHSNPLLDQTIELRLQLHLSE